MEVILNKTGEILDLPDRDAKRRIQRGQAHLAPVIKKKPKSRKKKKELEGNTEQEEKLSSEEVPAWGYSGLASKYSEKVD